MYVYIYIHTAQALQCGWFLSKFSFSLHLLSVGELKKTLISHAYSECYLNAVAALGGGQSCSESVLIYSCIHIYCVNPIGCNNLHDLEHDFWHEGEYQKAPCRARFLAWGKAPKSMIFGTRGGTKKHDFVHEEEHQKARSRARFFARGKAPKSTILCTKENTKNNVLPRCNFWGVLM